MQIVLFIDCLGSGGAQRQIVVLAKLLKKSGYDVSMLCYHRANAFYKPDLDNAGIDTVFCEGSKLLRIHKIRKYLMVKKPDVLIAFQESPAIIAEICKLLGGKFKLVVSDRNTDLNPKQLTKRIKYFMYKVADCVTTNSYSQYEVIAGNAPTLKQKLKVIPNCVDLDVFNTKEPLLNNFNTLLVAASVWPQKNPLNFIEAIRILYSKNERLSFKVKWVGKHSCNNDQAILFNKIQESLLNNKMNNILEFTGVSKDIVEEYRNAKVFCLPSFKEGCPNVIGEAMACGLPILASNVCDHPKYIEEGVNGFLFDPCSPDDIAAVIERFWQLTDIEKQKMGENNRNKAEVLFSESEFTGSYKGVINGLFE
ncbi:MAG: glycosyltransferase family 4 protein [Sedimentisphaeraceae bacterium JB056]